MANIKKRIALGFAPYPAQCEVINSLLYEDKKFYTLLCSRQWGKTLLIINYMLYVCINEPNSVILFTSNNFRAVKKVYEELIDAIGESGVIKNNNKTLLKVTFHTGSKIIFKSAERPNNLRGDTLTHFISDENAFCKKEVWEVVSPSLDIKGKKALFISTVDDYNHFWDKYQRGLSGKIKDKNWKSFLYDVYTNPFMTPEKIEEAQNGMPSHVFAKEYLCIPSSLSSSVFRNWQNCIYGNLSDYSSTGRTDKQRYYVGIDFGRNDYTVATCLDQQKNVVDILRVNKEDFPKDTYWSCVMDSVTTFVNKWKPIHAFAEINSMGEVVFELLKKNHGLSMLKPFSTQHNSKQNQDKKGIVDNLIMNFEKGLIKIPNEEYLLDEIKSFTYKYNPVTGKVTYGARSGNYNDDSVMSLCFALASHKQINPINSKMRVRRV